MIDVSALAHYHAAISINLNDADSTEDLTKEKFNNAKHMIELCDLANDEIVSPCALKKAHIRESHACHEEAQRLQRMCRELKVSRFRMPSFTSRFEWGLVRCFAEQSVADENLARGKSEDAHRDGVHRRRIEEQQFQ